MESSQSKQLQDVLGKLSENLAQLNKILEQRSATAEAGTSPEVQPKHSAPTGDTRNLTEETDREPSSVNEQPRLSGQAVFDNLIRRLQERRSELFENKHPLKIAALVNENYSTSRELPFEAFKQENWRLGIPEFNSTKRWLPTNEQITGYTSRQSPLAASNDYGKHAASAIPIRSWAKEISTRPYRVTPLISFADMIMLSELLRDPEQVARLVHAHSVPPTDAGHYSPETQAILLRRLTLQTNGSMTIEFTLRYWVNPAFHLRKQANYDLVFEENDLTAKGIRAERDAVRVCGSAMSALRENRSILAMNLSALSAHSEYTLVHFLDDYGISHRPEESTESFLRRHNLLGEAQPVGITHFLSRIIMMFQTSEEAWTSTLEGIDAVIFTKASELGQIWEADGENKMFDDSFDRSRQCFALLQFLRVSADRVLEAKDGFHDVRREIELMFATHDSKESESNTRGPLLHNLNSTAGYVDYISKKTLDRIDRKVEEVTRLRDGIFSATSLRETNDARSLNQAIYVFTIVTIVYTPMSFLATFWALPFLNESTSDQKVQSSPAFLLSVVLVPLLTYFASAVLPSIMPPALKHWHRSDTHKSWTQFCKRWTDLSMRHLGILLKTCAILVRLIVTYAIRPLVKGWFSLFGYREISVGSYVERGEYILRKLVRERDKYFPPDWTLLWWLFAPIRWVNQTVRARKARRDPED